MMERLPGILLFMSIQTFTAALIYHYGTYRAMLVFVANQLFFLILANRLPPEDDEDT